MTVEHCVVNGVEHRRYETQSRCVLIEADRAGVTARRYVDGQAWGGVRRYRSVASARRWAEAFVAA